MSVYMVKGAQVGHTVILATTCEGLLPGTHRLKAIKISRKLSYSEQQVEAKVQQGNFTQL